MISIVTNVFKEFISCSMVCSGVFKRLLGLWFSSENHAKDFYLGRMLKHVDERLMQIRVPHDFGRKPRSLEERKFFKGFK